MKRILALLLAVLVVFALASCGKKDEKKPADGENGETETESGENTEGKTDEGGEVEDGDVEGGNTEGGNTEGGNTEGGGINVSDGEGVAEDINWDDFIDVE